MRFELPVSLIPQMLARELTTRESEISDCSTASDAPDTTAPIADAPASTVPEDSAHDATRSPAAALHELRGTTTELYNKFTYRQLRSYCSNLSPTKIPSATNGVKHSIQRGAPQSHPANEVRRHDSNKTSTLWAAEDMEPHYLRHLSHCLKSHGSKRTLRAA